MQYLLTADDCGVMRASAMTLQAANERLAKLPAKKIEAALAKLVSIGLLAGFTHQKRAYVCQRDWQEWQKVRWPRASVNPQPDPETLATCTDATRALFATQAKHHRSGHGSVSEPSPSAHGEPAETPPSLARAELRLTATAEATAAANGSGRARTGSGAMAGELPRDHLRHAVCGRLCLHEKQFAEFVVKLGWELDLAKVEVRRWAESVLQEWGEGAKKNLVIQGDTFKWWNARYEEWQGSPKAAEKPRAASTVPTYTPWECPHTPPCPHRAACAIVAMRPEHQKAANA